MITQRLRIEIRPWARFLLRQAAVLRWLGLLPDWLARGVCHVVARWGTRKLLLRG